MAVFASKGLTGQTTMKRILVSLSIIGVVAGIAIGGTIAYFSDVETSKGNTLTAGTLELEIRDQDEGFGNGVVATWVASDIKPGWSDSFTVPFVGLKKLGTVDPDHLEITCDYQVIEEDPQTEADTDPNTDLTPDKMAKEMIITRCEYYDVVVINCLTDPNPDYRIEDKDGDGKITFFDLKQDPLDNIPPPGGSYAMGYFEMGVKFDEVAGNDFQGDMFDLTMIFTLNQDNSQ